jgi:hypothetical protein
MTAGMALSTLVFRYAQTVSLTPPSVAPPPYTGSVTEAQKLYISARTATSELLFKLAFTTLAALIGVEASESTRIRLSQRSVFAAAGLLFTSLFAAFLFQIGISHCMEASLDDMFGPILAYPILLQFWFLFAAAAIVAAALFRKPRRAAMAAAMFVVLATPVAAAPAYRDCVRTWAESQSIPLPAKASVDAEKLIKRLAAVQELEVAPADRCAVASTILDAVRYTALRDGKPAAGQEAGTALASMLHDARKAAESPNLSPGELVQQLLSIAEIWTVASGILDIDAAKTLFVTITDRSGGRPTQWHAYTRCRLRLPPGKYNVRAAEGTRIVFDKDVQLDRDARVPLRVGTP